MPKIVDHDAIRSELLTASLEVFAREGYSGLSMRGLSQELKVSTGKLYHYFPSKEVMFEQMVHHIASRDLGQAISDVELGQSADDRLMAVMAFVRAREEHLTNFLIVIVDFVRTTRDSTTGPELLRQTFAQYVEAITQNIPGATHEDATLLFDMICGMLLRRALARDDSRDFVRHLEVAQQLVRG